MSEEGKDPKEPKLSPLPAPLMPHAVESLSIATSIQRAIEAADLKPEETLVGVAHIDFKTGETRVGVVGRIGKSDHWKYLGALEVNPYTKKFVGAEGAIAFRF